MNPVKKWWMEALSILTMLSSVIDWPALSHVIASNPRTSRFLAGLMFLAAKLSQSNVKPKV